MKLDGEINHVKLDSETNHVKVDNETNHVKVDNESEDAGWTGNSPVSRHAWLPIITTPDHRPRSGLTPPHTRRCGRNLMTATTTRERWLCSGQIGKTVACASSTLSLGLEQWPSRMAVLCVGAAVAASSLLGAHSGSARLALSAPLHTFPLSAAGPSTNTSPYRTTQPPLMAWHNSIPASSSDTGTFASDQRWLALVVYWVQFTFRTPPPPSSDPTNPTAETHGSAWTAADYTLCSNAFVETFRVKM